jgi:hypothetical protein
MPDPIATTATPAPAAVTPTAPTTPAVETKPEAPAEGDLAQKYRRLEAEHNRKVKEQIIERRKWDADRKTTGERLSKLAELEKRESQARLNPPAFLKSIYGDNWHEVVNESKLNGVPPADLIQSEMARMRDEFEAKLKARDDESSRSLQAQQQQALEQARANIRAEAEEFYAASGADYPILERLGGKEAVARAIAQRIEHEFHATAKRDENGGVVRQGRVLTTKEAAELIEGEMLAVAEHALKAEKYKSRFAPKPPDLTAEKKSESLKLKQQPTSQQQSSGQQPRKSLSNDITGSTKDDAPARLTPEERRQRALAAFAAVKERKAAAHH